MTIAGDKIVGKILASQSQDRIRTDITAAIPGSDIIGDTDDNFNNMALNIEEIVLTNLEAVTNSRLRYQSFTSLMADLRQDINSVASFSRCRNGTFP